MGPWQAEEFTAQLEKVGRERYHDKHPFHQLMHAGELNREQLQLWVANRFYYQRNIPIKDAILLSKCEVVEVRRQWITRIMDHDGSEGDPGGIERWLRLGEGVGLAREQLQNNSLLLPGVRYAVDAYLNFVAARSWIEGVASSLTERFAPDLMAKRLEALQKHYPWIDPEALAYFRSRPALAERDSRHGTVLVLHYCRSREQQEAAAAALRFKCDLLWAQLDALYHACVCPNHVERP